MTFVDRDYGFTGRRCLDCGHRKSTIHANTMKKSPGKVSSKTKLSESVSAIDKQGSVVDGQQLVPAKVSQSCCYCDWSVLSDSNNNR